MECNEAHLNGSETKSKRCLVPLVSLLIFYLQISLSIAERCEDNTIYKYYCLNIAERCEGNTIYNIRFGHKYFLYFIV